MLDSPFQNRVQARHVAETHPAYPHLLLNDRWRVCCDGIQWILQRRASAETYSTAIWRATREALTRSCRARAGSISPSAAAVLAALPERIERDDAWRTLFASVGGARGH